MVLVVGKAVVGLGLLVALGLAGAGPAPRRPAPAHELRRLLGAIGLLDAAAVAAWALGHGLIAEAACAFGVALAALAGWLSRGEDDGGDDGLPVGGAPAPVDWRHFDRARRGWERPRTPSPR